jgi:hypothetical protein
VKVTAPLTGEKTFFAHHDFPSGAGASDAHVRSHLAMNAQEDYATKLSDFNLLCYLPKVVGTPITLRICDALGKKTPFDKQLREDIDSKLMEKNMF